MKTKFGKILALTLALVMLLSVIPATNAFAAEVVDSGTCGENLTWTLDDEGTLMISGTGEMTNYGWVNPPWYNDSSIKNVVINNSVTSIGNYAFRGCTGLTSVTIPDSVTSIGSYAFSGCTGLTSVTIPNSVTIIGRSAFSSCSGLTSVTIPNSVTSIGDSAFYYCSGLTSVTIPNSVTSIGDSAFYYCSALTSVTIPDSVTSIGNWAFEDCTGLTSVTIPDSVISIGSSAFGYCTGLTSVTIPDSVTSIGNYAFYGCSALTSVTIPDSVISIGEDAFYNTAYYKDDSNWKDNVLYIGNHLIKSKFGITGDYNIKENTKTIADSAFYRCGLTSINIPDSVTSIGDYAFNDCSALTSVTIGNGVTSIGNRAFYNCTGLTSITIPDSVISIGSFAFEFCTGLTSVTIPDSVISIGSSAFEYCTGLTSIEIDENNEYYSSQDGVLFNKDKTELIQYPVGNSRTEYTIPNSVTSIGGYAFEGCKGLTSIAIPDSVTSIGNWVFALCSGLTSVTIPDSVTSIGDVAFKNCTSLTGITIGNSVTSIGWRAFENCTGLTGITIPDSVTSIGEDAFWNCTSLTSVTIGNSVTSIGEDAFYGCTGLTSVTIGNGVTSIGSSAFADCTGLTSIEIDENNEYYSSQDGVLFNKDKTELIQYPVGNSRTGYTIPNSVKSIGYDAFRNCTGLTSITIPDSVTSIGDYAFYGCTSLTSVTIPDSVTSIGSYALGYYIYNWRTYKLYDFTIYGYSGSAAETYANENEFAFVSLGTSQHKHSYSLTERVEPTCTEDGHETYTCECGDTYTNILSGGHSFSNWKITKPATADEPGEQERYCDRCGETESESFTTPNVIHSENTDIYVEFGDEFAGYDDVHVVTEAFADENGNIYGWNISIMSGDTEIQPDGYVTVKIPVPDWCPEDGYTLEDYDIYHYGIEPMNAVVIDGYWVFRTNSFSEFSLNRDENAEQEHVHTYTATVTAPTCTEKGYTTYTCECGESYEDDYVDATGHNNVGGTCTVCGHDFTKDCGCKCHKSGFTLFIWKIGNFFHKLFRMNKYYECACGRHHW